jgi:two-component sensor histidine kinase
MQELGERSASLKLNLVTRTGASSPVDLRLALVTDGGGQLLFSIHFFSPVITAQPAPAAPQVAVSAPIPRETRTHAMLLLTTDVHGRVQEWSDDATERFGYEPSEIIGRGLHLLFSPSDATGFYSNLLALAANDGAQPASIEWTFFHKSEGRQQGPFLMHLHEGNGLAGSLMEEVIVFGPVSPDAAAVADDTEDSRVVPLLLDDVPPDTARPTPPVKPTQEDLSRERILLGEAHHRVKNHLQIITSMLNLQMSTVHNDEARDALRSSQNRVRSIAALHQHLFQLTTGATADFQSFASGLIGHLRECYQVDEQRVPLQLTVPDRPVPEEWLMPLALSLNEMVANAFKHAYAGHREGSMSVTLSWDDAGGELSVVDDGAGLPPGFSHHDSAGLGLKILRVFAGQLGGEVRIEGNANQGTAFRLTFPVLSDEIAQESPPDS